MNNLSRLFLRSLALSRTSIAGHSKQILQLNKNLLFAPNQLYNQPQFRFSSEKKPEEKVEEKQEEEVKSTEEKPAETEQQETKQESKEEVKEEIRPEMLPSTMHALLEMNTPAANKKALGLYKELQEQIKNERSKLKDSEVQRKSLDTANVDHLKKVDEYKKIIKNQNDELDLTVVRLKRERDQQKVFAISKFAKEVLEVSDNLDRAISNSKDKSEDDPLLEGTKMTFRVLDQILKRNGVEQQDPVGKKFDPNFYDALLYVPDETKEPNTIAEVATPGYVIGERILRPAKVIVVKPQDNQ